MKRTMVEKNGESTKVVLPQHAIRRDQASRSITGATQVNWNSPSGRYVEDRVPGGGEMGGLCSGSFHLRDQRAFHLHTHWKSGSETIFKPPLRLKISNPKIGGFSLYKFPSNKPQSGTPHKKEVHLGMPLLRVPPFCGWSLRETHQGTHRFMARAEERREGLLLRQPAVEVRLPQRGQALRIQPRGFGARSARRARGSEAETRGILVPEPLHPFGRWAWGGRPPFAVSWGKRKVEGRKGRKTLEPRERSCFRVVFK